MSRPPALTGVQREDIGRILRRRRELKRIIRQAEIEFAGLPNNLELVAKYGVSVTSLHNYAFGTSANPHPLYQLTTTQSGDSP